VGVRIPPSAPLIERASKRWPFFVFSYRTATGAIRVRSKPEDAPRIPVDPTATRRASSVAYDIVSPDNLRVAVERLDSVVAGVIR
jgi:hypothetical protein